jgi:hypothetical protein
VFDGVVSESELQELEEVVDRFIDGKMTVPGRDFCDMSKGLDAKPEEFSIVNAMYVAVACECLVDPILAHVTEVLSRCMLLQASAQVLPSVRGQHLRAALLVHHAAAVRRRHGNRFRPDPRQEAHQDRRRSVRLSVHASTFLLELFGLCVLCAVFAWHQDIAV